jgi:hypothetical protein
MLASDYLSLFFIHSQKISSLIRIEKRNPLSKWKNDRQDYFSLQKPGEVR